MPETPLASLVNSVPVESVMLPLGVAGLAAKRCSLLEQPADRELIWFIQHLSHQPGGLLAVTRAIMAQGPDGKVQERADYLRELCLNPATSFEVGPNGFPDVINALRKYRTRLITAKRDSVFIAELGRKVFEVLDYTAYCRGLTLIQGDARLGKTHAGRTWCELHPGKARFVEVPTGNDEATFFRDLARGLGLGNFLNYKTVQIRERVESILRTGDLMLVLDEAQRLWPQTNIREGYPKRIAWVMTMANAGVPIGMISTPQFFVIQRVIEKNGWNSSQLIGRLSLYESLPQDLSLDDLMGVARAVLPEANPAVLRALAVYARSSARYLAAIDAIAKRARYIAMQTRRSVTTAEDVRKAMQESVIPADTKLFQALERGRSGKLSKLVSVAATSSGRASDDSLMVA